MSPQLATTALVLAGLLAQVVPSWWQQRGVLTPGAEPDDYAALNQGQLKNLARAAIDEMNHRLPPPPRPTNDRSHSDPSEKPDPSD